MHTRGQIRWKLDVGSWRNVISFTAQKNPHFASAWPIAPKISCFLVHRFWFWANLARILTARSHNHFRSIQCKFGDDCFNWFFPTILLADKHTRPKKQYIVGVSTERGNKINDRRFRGMSEEFQAVADLGEMWIGLQSADCLEHS